MTERLPDSSQLSVAERAALEQRLLDAAASRAARARAIPPRARTGPLPLSFAQRRLWIIDQLAPGLPTYNVGRIIRLRGALDAASIERTLAALMRRHEPLRTVFRSIGGEPTQVILPDGSPELIVVDLSHSPASARDRIAREQARQELDRPFDLANGPLMRAMLLRLDPDHHLLTVCIHHIATDGWSEHIFWREFRTLYDGFVRDEPVSLPELPIQYADFAAWQNEWLSGERRDALLNYWLGAVGDLPPLELPTDFPRPTSFSWRGDLIGFTIPAALTEQLRRLALDAGVTLYMVLMAAFQLLLHYYSQQTLFAIGTPVAGRNRLELEPLVGFFVNTLVIRADLNGDPTFRELLDRVRQTTVGAFDHQDLPFEQLVEALRPQRLVSRHPVFQVMFQLTPGRERAWGLTGIQAEPVTSRGETAKFDLLLSMNDRGDELSGRLSFTTDLFAPSTIERMAGDFTSLLEAIAADPARRASQIPWLSPAERDQLVVEWNDTAVDYPSAASLAELFERQVAQRPEAPALCFDNDVLSYGELNRRANRIAHALRRRGLQPGAVVALSLPRSPEMIAAVIGILKAGGVYFPLETNAPAARLKFLLDDAGAQLLLTAPETRDRLPATAAEIMTLDALIAASSPSESENPPRDVTGADAAYIMYTSGSTGNPKGVVIRQRSVARLVHGVEYVHLGPDETLLHLATLAFDASTFEIWGALLHGSPLVLAPDGPLDYVALEALIKRWGVSTVWLTAGLFNSIIDSHPQMLGSVRQALTGGERLSVAHVRRAQHLLPDTRFVNGYGPTENTTFTCCYPIPSPLPNDLASIPIGRPVPNTQVYVLNSRLEPVPVGIVGELYTGGDGLAKGYLNRPELNAERFVDNPFNPGTRLYRTGDQVRWLADGNLEFIGRTDTQVKLRGYRIELGEIQAQLDSHPLVHRSAVQLAASPSGDPRLVAYVVPREVHAPSGNDLRAYLQERLPTYMIPAAYVLLPDLPLTANGKIDYSRLAAQTTDPTPETAAEQPLTPHETAVAAIFSELLGREHVGRHDNFFILGGHSLLAARVVNVIAGRFGRDIPPGILFEKPTVAELAGYLATMAPVTGEREATDGTGPARQSPAIVAAGLGEGDRPPLTDAEQELTAIWQRVLGLPQIGLHDEFFALGGHSLLAAQLLVAIEQAFGQRLPADVLFQAPTIAEMAQVLDRQLPAGSTRTLVPIATADGEPPFFFIHGFGGGVLGYADLAGALKPSYSVYGLQAAGLDATNLPDRTIAAMAERYVADMRSVQPHGPYHLGGYCYGGVVAFEMARQLEAAGEEVGLVALIEGYAPRQFQQRLSVISLQRWQNIWHNIPFWLQEYWELGLRSLSAQARRKGRRWLKGMRRRFGQAVAFDAQDAINDDVASLPLHQRQLMEVQLVALRDYTPQPIAGPLTLFAAEGKTMSTALFGSGDPTYGWDALTLSGVKTITVPGGHRNLHLAPNAAALAAAMREELLAASGTPS